MSDTGSPAGRSVVPSPGRRRKPVPQPDNGARRREYYAGGLLVVIGLLAGYIATTYDLGRLDDLGPGFFPLVLCVLLVALGIATMATAGRAAALPEGPAPMKRTGDGTGQHAGEDGPDWRGWFAIVAAVIAFVVLARFTGAAPATFACVFVAALGDRHNTPFTAALLALAITAFAVTVLVWGLQVQMPIFGSL